MSASRSRTWTLGSAGSISPKAGKRLARRLNGLKLAKDEGSVHQTGEVPGNHINHPTNQGGSYGRRVSAGGGAGREGQVGGGHIDMRENRRTWPGGGGISASNPKTGNTRMKGPIAKTGGPYGGGGRDTQ